MSENKEGTLTYAVCTGGTGDAYAMLLLLKMIEFVV